MLELPEKILQIFPPHSFNTTVLVRENGRPTIRKLAPLQFTQKLHFQANWLKATAHLGHIPEVLAIGEVGEQAFYDLEFIPHAKLEAVSQLERIVAFMEGSVFPLIDQYEEESRPRDVARYLLVKVVEKIATCHIPDQELVLNGVPMRSPRELIYQWLDDTRFLTLIADFEAVFLHGDLTIENILTSGDQFFLIDPNNENLLLDPVVDFAKLMQSLDSGYENFSSASLVWHSDVSADYEIPRSPAYHQTAQMITHHVLREYGDAALLRMTLHQAIHFARMLPYKMKFDPQGFWLAYFELVRCLNRFEKMY